MTDRTAEIPDDLVKRLREGWHKVECLMGQAFAAKAPGDYGYFSRSAQIRFAEMQHYVCESADALESKDARIAELEAELASVKMLNRDLEQDRDRVYREKRGSR